MKFFLFTMLLFMLSSGVYGQSVKSIKHSQKAINQTHLVSSIRQEGDSLAVNQMVILKNKNLNAFISDLQKSPMVLGKNVKRIPEIVKSFLISFSRDKFSIADPGKNWNCCDGSWNDNLPNRELINIGTDGHLFLITYLTGGIGEVAHIILIKYDNDRIIDFWTGTRNKELKTKSQILKYLITNRNKHWGLNTNVIRI
ncbi:MAG: hypothetical protein JWQ57_723 [Mucilaginibacter sp.]|nr:hypothetical protein [Mucilaginibacter sp.]